MPRRASRGSAGSRVGAPWTAAVAPSARERRGMRPSTPRSAEQWAPLPRWGGGSSARPGEPIKYNFHPGSRAVSSRSIRPRTSRDDRRHRETPAGSPVACFQEPPRVSRVPHSARARDRPRAPSFAHAARRPRTRSRASVRAHPRATPAPVPGDRSRAARVTSLRACLEVASREAGGRQARFADRRFAPPRRRVRDPSRCVARARIRRESPRRSWLPRRTSPPRATPIWTTASFSSCATSWSTTASRTTSNTSWTPRPAASGAARTRAGSSASRAARTCT